jgi:hypothetical protein
MLVAGASRVWLWPRREKLAVAGSAVAVLAIFVGGYLIVVGQAQPFLARQAGASAAGRRLGGGCAHPGRIAGPTASREAEFTLTSGRVPNSRRAAAQCTATVAVRNCDPGIVVWAARMMQRLGVDRDRPRLTPDPGFDGGRQWRCGSLCHAAECGRTALCQHRLSP